MIESALLAALKKDNPDLAEHPEVFLVAASRMLAEELEAAPDTKRRARSLAYNLVANQSLRRSLLSGALTPKDLCAMDATEWAAAAVKRARESAADRSQKQLRMALTGGELYSWTRSVHCERCGGSVARFKHLGTDMKDWHGRKNEVWGSKHEDDEGQDCLIECASCEHSWRSTAPELSIDDDLEQDELEQPRRKDLVNSNSAGTVHRRD